MLRNYNNVDVIYQETETMTLLSSFLCLSFLVCLPPGRAHCGVCADTGPNVYISNDQNINSAYTMSVPSNESTRLIHTWSGPRSLSTAFLYSFAQRPGCKTFDEPLYAAFLRKFPEVSRPYREELLESEPESANEVLQKLLSATASNDLVFAKHMGRHCTDDLDPATLSAPGSRHVILIRNPLELIMSWNVKATVHNESDLSNVTNLHELVGIYMKIRMLTGCAPVIVDMDALKREPERILRALCSSLNIPFYTEQLSWPAGPKPGIDG